MSVTRRIGWFLLMLVVLGASLNGCGTSWGNVRNYSFGSEGVEGTGSTVSETRIPGGDFSRIQANGALSLRIIENATPDITVEAQENLQSHITTVIEGGVLRIRMDNVSTTKPVTVTIHCSGIHALELSGAVTAQAAGLTGEQVTVVASGASTATVTGSATGLRVDASGSSAIDASRVSAKRIQADASGASRITLAGASHQVHLEASGASSVQAGALQADEANLSASGVSTIHLGRAGKVTQSSSGVSTITVQ